MKHNDELMNVSNLLNVGPFNSELTDTLMPQSKLEQEYSSWEEKLIMNLNSMKELEKDDRKTS